MRCLRHAAMFAKAVLLLAVMASPAAAGDTVRIADQYGLSYLPLRVAIAHKLIEKHAAANGLPDAKVEIVQLGSGAAVNTAMISGDIDVAMAGTTVLLNLWDKTFDTNVVKGMMAIADTPIYFDTTNPRLKSIKDLTDSDRIAMTAGRGTTHFLVLQMAAAKQFGWDERTKLDSLTVSMAHPDGVKALLSGVVDVHATTVPYIQMELADPRVRTILNSYDVVGGPHTLIVAYATERWREENPKLYAATVAGLTEAMDMIAKDKKAAAELYARSVKSRLSADDILKILDDKNMLVFTPTPSKVALFANYMERIGLLKHRLNSWKDVFFDNVYALPGS